MSCLNLKTSSDKLYDSVRRHPYLCAFICAVISMPLNALSFNDINPFGVALCIGALLCLFVLLFLKTELRLKPIVCLAFVGFLLRVAYCSYLVLPAWQHDVAYISSDYTTHGGYIMTIFEGRFPDSYDGQFYHPPLHHFISAAWLKIQAFFGIGLEAAIENLQILTLFYSSCCMISAYKIGRLLGLKAFGVTVCTAVIALHPSFFILASSINNDILCIALMLASVLCALKWYFEPTFANILKTAFSIGFAMMTKLSGAYVAFPIAFLFAVALIRSLMKKHTVAPKCLALQFLSFGAICFPLGLWWGIRNKMLFDIPLTYVPRLDDIEFLDISGHTVFERLFDFSNYQNAFSASGWIPFCNGVTLDYNIPLAMFKTSLFGEYSLGWGIPVCEFLAVLLLIMAVVLAVGAFISMIFFTVRSYVKKDESRIFDTFFVILYTAIVALYVKFCFDFPQNCTMDFRYIVPVLLVAGFYLGRLCDAKNKPCKYITAFCTFAFCFCSGVFYILGAVL